MVKKKSVISVPREQRECSQILCIVHNPKISVSFFIKGVKKYNIYIYKL